MACWTWPNSGACGGCRAVLLLHRAVLLHNAVLLLGRGRGQGRGWGLLGLWPGRGRQQGRRKTVRACWERSCLANAHPPGWWLERCGFWLRLYRAAQYGSATGGNRGGGWLPPLAGRAQPPGRCFCRLGSALLPPPMLVAVRRRRRSYRARRWRRRWACWIPTGGPAGSLGALSCLCSVAMWAMWAIIGATEQSKASIEQSRARTGS